MKAIILAAGRGTRLAPYTNARPKCLVEIDGVSLLARQSLVLSKCGLTDVTVVAGYLAEQIESLGYKTIRNPNYETTNMVASLGLVDWSDFLDDDLVISYGDVIHHPYIVSRLMAETADVVVPIDLRFREYWHYRFEQPLLDLETLKLDRDKFIIDIGGVPDSYEGIEGQYMGLLKLSSDAVNRLSLQYKQFLSGGAISINGRSYETAYMTDLLMDWIVDGVKVASLPCDRDWLEVDTVSDLLLPLTSQRANNILLDCAPAK